MFSSKQNNSKDEIDYDKTILRAYFIIDYFGESLYIKFEKVVPTFNLKNELILMIKGSKFERMKDDILSSCEYQISVKKCSLENNTITLSLDMGFTYEDKFYAFTLEREIIPPKPFTSLPLMNIYANNITQPSKENEHIVMDIVSNLVTVVEIYDID